MNIDWDFVSFLFISLGDLLVAITVLLVHTHVSNERVKISKKQKHFFTQESFYGWCGVLFILIGVTIRIIIQLR